MDMNGKRIGRKIGVILLGLMLLAGCGTSPVAPPPEEGAGGEVGEPIGGMNSGAAVPDGTTKDVGQAGGSGTGVPTTIEEIVLPEPAAFSDKEMKTDWSGEEAIRIDLSGQTGPVRITSAGTYVLSGHLADGGVIVEVGKSDDVRLVLAGAHIYNSRGPAIDIREADKVIITLEDGTENSASDGSGYADTSDGAANAAVYSKADLAVNGSGKWTIEGNYKDGLTSRDDLKITGGILEITAVDDGVTGRDLLAVHDGTIVVKAGGDGFKSTNDKDAGRGNIAIEGGVIDLTTGGDGMQSAVSVRVDGGRIKIVAGGGSEQRKANSTSMKGIKAASELLVTGGDVVIDSADDALHSNGSVIIQGGHLLLASGDDGIHADAGVLIEDGIIRITNSYEGVEGAVVVISGGDLRVRSDDDGINVAGGNDAPGGGGRFGPDSFRESGERKLEINGGNILVDADGDGLDANGSIVMSGGIVVVQGPTADYNAAIDYDRIFNMNGGLLIASGSAGMAMAPSASSAQPAVAVLLSSIQKAGTEVRLTDADGNEVAAVAPEKPFQTVVISTPALKIGETYVLSMGSRVNVTFELETIIWLNEEGVTTAPRGFGGRGRGPGGMR